MAPPAVESFVGRGVALWGLLRAFPGRAGFAVRLALICALSAGVSLLFRAPEAALAVYVVLFMNKPDRASSLLGSLALTVVISLVIVVMVGICALVLEHPAWRLANMVAVSLLLLWLVSASKLRPVGGTLTLVLAYAMDLLGSIPTGEVATRGFLYAWQLVAIPAGVSILVNLLMAPAPRTLLQSGLAERLRTAAAALLGDATAARRLQSHLRGGLNDCNLWLRRLSVEHGVPAQDRVAL
jgi:multidrug resistance protein MdtO